MGAMVLAKIVAPNTFGESKLILVFKLVWQFLPKINGHK